MVIVTVMSLKKGFASSFAACGLGAIIIIIAETHSIDRLIPVAVLGAKAGVSVAFSFFYFSIVSYFPSTHLGLVMGFSNVAGRLSSIMAPIVAEMRDPIPMMTTMVLCVMAFAGSMSLK